MFLISFYDWCINNNHSDFLNRWDYDLNKIDPKDVSASSIDKYYFICPNKEHPSQLHSLSDIKRHEKIPQCKICNSFGYWCEHNNRPDLLKRWDYNLNKKTPYEVSIATKFDQYFLCPKGIHKSELKNLNNLRKQYGSSRCYQCDSIGQFGIDNISKNFIKEYWSDKNDTNPFDINKFSNKKIWINCQNKDYHQDYEISTTNFRKGERCPYCASKKIHILDSLGTLFEKSIKAWSDKNEKTPFDYFPQSNKTVFWECENNKHDSYKRKIVSSVQADFRCPECVRKRNESFLQEKVRKYLENIFTNINHEHDCLLKPINPDTGYVMPYDNEIVDIKLIIEVNGQQHYSKNSFNGYFSEQGLSPEESLKKRQLYDEYKKQFALDNGYSFLEIPYWTDNKKETWKELINNKIKSIAKI